MRARDTVDAMSLTLRPGPLATNAPAEVNYTIDGPAHRLLLTPFPRRVRAELGGVTVLDTLDGALVHESNLLPMLYVPAADVDTGLLEPTDLSTHCPFKGDAAYWSVRVGDRVAENAVWSYLEPIEGAGWLDGRLGFYWDRLDRWFDEDEEVHGHLRDPYHRADVRPSSRVVTVRVGDVVVASRPARSSCRRPGCPTAGTSRPRTPALLVASATTSHCPYKGDASYWSFRSDGVDVVNVAWSYEEPYDGVQRSPATARSSATPSRSRWPTRCARDLDASPRPLGGSGIEVSLLSLGSWRALFERISRGGRSRRHAGRPRGRESTSSTMTKRRRDGFRRRSRPGTPRWCSARLSAPPGGRAYDVYRRQQAVVGALARAGRRRPSWRARWGALGLDHVDLIYAIAPPPQLPVAEVVGEVAGLIESGRARAWGTGMWSAAQLAEAIDVCDRTGVAPTRRSADGLQPGSARSGRRPRDACRAGPWRCRPRGGLRARRRHADGKVPRRRRRPGDR